MILHPHSWNSIRVERASGSGEYVGPSWVAEVQPRIFGLDVITSASMTQGVAIVMDRAERVAAIIDRQQVNVRLSEHAGDNFSQNLISFRAELRAGLMVASPSGVLKLTLTL